MCKGVVKNQELKKTNQKISKDVDIFEYKAKETSN